MIEVSYGITKQLPDTPYEEAVRRTTEALGTEGFGILTEIDVKATLKKKLDVDFRKYVILGACNPSLAHRALMAEMLIGLLLPCNVVVAETDKGGSIVAILDPQSMFSLVDNPGIEPLAKEVREKLQRALEQI